MANSPGRPRWESVHGTWPTAQSSGKYLGPLCHELGDLISIAATDLPCATLQLRGSRDPSSEPFASTGGSRLLLSATRFHLCRTPGKIVEA